MNKTLWVTLAITLAAATVGLLYHLHHRGGSSGTLYHVRTEFAFNIRAPYSIAAPLFGPEGERAWADGWDPHFLYPQPAQDIQGAIFQVSQGHRTSTWVNTVFNLEQGHIQYIYVIPEIMVTSIDIHFSKPSAETTGVRVAYERTALSSEANEHVRQFGEDDQNSGKVWGDDIERYLAARTLR